MELTRRGFASLLTALAPAAPAVALTRAGQRHSVILTAATPTPENTTIHVDAERMKPRPRRTLLLVYKPWTIDEAAFGRLETSLGVSVVAIPTCDSSAPDVRFFDLDKVSSESGVIEALEGVKASMFDRKILPDPDIHEIAMILARLVSQRLEHNCTYESGYRKDGARPGYVINFRTERLALIAYQDNGCVSPTTAELISGGLDRATRIYFEPVADHLAKCMNTRACNLFTVDLAMPSGTNGTAAVDFGGVALRAVRYYDPNFDLFTIRFDVLYGRTGEWQPSLVQPWLAQAQFPSYYVEPRYDAWPPDSALSMRSSTNRA